MKSSRKIFLLLCFLFSVVLAVNLSFDPSSRADYADSKVNLTVSAAVSLKDSLESIQLLDRQTKANTSVTYNFGSSGSLQQQIEQGSPTDIFISASPKQMDSLQEKGLIIEDTRRNLLKNKLVLIVPKDNETIEGFKDLELGKVKTIALGEPESVPVGKYANEVLKYLGILEPVKKKTVYGKDVRQVLNYVATENADAGIVYLTDAKTSDRVKIVAIADEEFHSPIVYPAAVIKDSKRPEEAKELLEFLSSNKAKTVFNEYGFVTIDPEL